MINDNLYRYTGVFLTFEFHSSNSEQTNCATASHSFSIVNVSKITVYSPHWIALVILWKTVSDWIFLLSAINRYIAFVKTEFRSFGRQCHTLCGLFDTEETSIHSHIIIGIVRRRESTERWPPMPAWTPPFMTRLPAGQRDSTAAMNWMLSRDSQHGKPTTRTWKISTILWAEEGNSALPYRRGGKIRCR